MRLVNLKQGLVIRPLELRDVYELKNWARHDNPLLQDYDFPYTSDKSLENWYLWKTMPTHNRYFAIQHKGKMAGYLGLKHLSLLHGRAELGIVLNPAIMDQGIGTQTLRMFLHYYFEEMDMKELNLEVAAYNERARKVYERLGFVETKKNWSQYPNEEPPEYFEDRGYGEVFRYRLGKWESLFIRMILTKKAFYERERVR